MDKEFRIRDLTEFIPAVIRIRDDWFAGEPTWVPWFRGHATTNWKLIPKVYRHRPIRRSIRTIEDEIRQEFIMRGPGLTGLAESQLQNSWDWYFIMQHSGAPTRLLDWTEGALIALYFAVRDSDGTHDACVWVLDPWWLNKSVVGEREVVAPGATVGILEKDAVRYSPWLPDRYETAELPQFPVAVYPSHTARRLSTQRSCFTIHGSNVEGLEELGHEKSAHLLKIIVSGAAVFTIAKQLMVCGIDEVTIFPDLDGLGRLLTTTLKTESDAG